MAAQGSAVLAVELDGLGVACCPTDLCCDFRPCPLPFFMCKMAVIIVPTARGSVVSE